MKYTRNGMKLFTKTTRQIDNSGEDLACKFLKQQGYQILKRNFTIRGGEIDIIVRERMCWFLLRLERGMEINLVLPEKPLLPGNLGRYKNQLCFISKK